MGGTSNGGNHTAVIQKFLFTTETSTLLAATLSVTRYGLAGVNSSIRGYFGGGNASTGTGSEIDGLQFSDETAINSAAGMSVAYFYTAGTQSGSL